MNDHNHKNRPDLLTVNEAARRLAISRGMLYKLMNAGELPYVKIGTGRRIEADAIPRLIDRNRVGSPLAQPDVQGPTA